MSSSRSSAEWVRLMRLLGIPEPFDHADWAGICTYTPRDVPSGRLASDRVKLKNRPARRRDAETGVRRAGRSATTGQERYPATVPDTRN